MAIIVVGGHSRNIGKTSAVASLIRALPHYRWTAFKVTQFGHGFCSADGKPCDCATDAHTVAVSAERDPSTGTDSARFLGAGAVRSFWVRTRIGHLAEAMPRIRQELANAENAIFESNSILRFLRPDLYLALLDPSVADFKDSARFFLDRADALLVRDLPDGAAVATSTAIPSKLTRGKPAFPISPPDYMSDGALQWIERCLKKQ
jgi:hypothetical protein